MGDEKRSSCNADDAVACCVRCDDSEKFLSDECEALPILFEYGDFEASIAMTVVAERQAGYGAGCISCMRSSTHFKSVPEPAT